jgi:hypothetical protein
MCAVRDADEHFHDEAGVGDRDDPDHAHFQRIFNQTEFNASMAGGLYTIAVQGHEVAETRQRLHAAATNYAPEWERSRIDCLILDAALALRSDDTEEGVSLGLAAVDAAAAIDSGRAVDNVRLIAAAAEPFDTSAARELKGKAARLIETKGAAQWRSCPPAQTTSTPI